MSICDYLKLETPTNPDIPIWKYFDFTKYVDLLDRSSLFFARAHLMEDQFEGAVSGSTLELRLEAFRSAGIEDENDLRVIQKSRSNLNRNIRPWMLLQCWHLNEHESAAMWKLYSTSNQAVAIQSSYSRLHDVLSLVDEKISLGKVVYIDYARETIPEDNILWPFFYKRQSFEHERELRAVAIDPRWPPRKDGQIDLTLEPLDTGIYIHCPISKLVVSRVLWKKQNGVGSG